MAGTTNSPRYSESLLLISTQAKREQAQRIINSAAFRNATLLQNFLEYVTSKLLDDDIEGISEYAIATQVFKRPSGFDPSSDTIVRTQAYRLRGKLKEYYESEGVSDPILLEIPKGHYVPVFARRDEVRSGQAGAPAVETPVSADSIPSQQSHPPFRVSFLLAGALLLLTLGALVGWQMRGRSKASKPDPADPAIAFWTSFVGDDREAVVAYSNSVFLNTDGGDLLRFRGGATGDRGAEVTRQDAERNLFSPGLMSKAGPLFYEDGYTGTGEVSGALRIATMLTRLGVAAVAKRSRIAGVYDIRSHNVIFLGSTIQNPSLAELKQPDYFSIEEPRKPPFLWQSRIINKHPAPGEQPYYQTERDPVTRIIKADYAIFGVLPGPTPERRIMVLAGLTTSGTQGAADFSCSPTDMSILKKKLGTRGDFPRYFQSVLRVETSKGLDAMQIKLVAGRVILRDEQ
ncbi:MAG: hypothetical protein U0Q18_14155 [Bryobacteraceae bacterium]